MSKPNQPAVKPGDLVRFRLKWDSDDVWDAWESGLVVRTWISNVATHIKTGERTPLWSAKVIKSDGRVTQFGLAGMTVEVVQQAMEKT